MEKLSKPMAKLRHAQLPWGWTKDDATRIRFCYAKSRSLRKQNWLELRSNSESVWQLGKAINGINLRVLSEDEVAFIEKMIKAME